VLRARHTNKGIYHLRSTPSMTATRGCSADGGPSLLSGVWEVEEVGEGGIVEADGEATSLANWLCSISGEVLR